MFKKLLSLVLATVIVMGTCINASAAEIKTSQSENIQKMYELDSKYDAITINSIDNLKSKNNGLMLRFDTIEEFENFLISLESPEVKKLPDVVIPSNQDNLTRAYNGVSTGTKWVPFVNIGTGLFCWFHTDVQYTYDHDKNNKPYFISATGANSYISGITASSWTQISATQNVINNTIKSQVNGTWFVGIEVVGIQIGSTIRDSYSWNTYWE